MNPNELFGRYQELQSYVGWTDADAGRVQAVKGLVEPRFRPLIDDFYEEIQRHPEAVKVITGGTTQIERLKQTLRDWLADLFTGPYDARYVARRWRVGLRHVEIGLNQVYTNVALSRLRTGLVRTLHEAWTGDARDLKVTVRSLNMLLDLDLAIIEDAYQTEHLAREQRVERLVAIGQVAAGVAHELRNPLNVVKTSVYYLLHARNATPQKTAEHLQRIERHVVVADSVITALSNFAKLPIPNLQPFAVGPWVQETLETNAMPETVRVVVDCPASLPPALADVDQVRIVLGNLVRNARDAMPQGGTLTIRCRHDGDAVAVAVTDTGVGIPAENLHRILEPLFSTKAKGLGLGLSIARAILEKNKGSLTVTSAVGQGSTFTIRLTAA